jgi:hypothetical protein
VFRNPWNHCLTRKTVQLASKAVSFDLNVHQPQVRRFSLYRGGKQDRPGAGSPKFHSLVVPAHDHLVYPEDAKKPRDTGTFTAWNDQAPQMVKLLGMFDRNAPNTDTFEMIEMFNHIALQIKHPDHVAVMICFTDI